MERAMNARICLKSEASPGFAKRAESYQATVEACTNRAADPTLNRLKVDKALALGTADLLTPQERCLMMALLSHLDIAGTAAGDTCVWPGSTRLCRLLGLGESTLRRLKASLEQKGLILRRYDHHNRPLNKGALDLKPFLLRVPELLAAIGHTDTDLTACKDKARSERVDHRSNQDAVPLTFERPIKETFHSDISERPVTLFESKGVAPTNINDGVEERQLAAVIAPELTNDPLKAASELFGSTRGPRLWAWATRRHADRAELALAIAAKSAKVRDRTAWFAWFATSSADVDLRATARDLLPSETAISPTEKRPIGLAGELYDAFIDEAGDGPAVSYLCGARARAFGDMISVSVQSRLAKRRLQTELEQSMHAAAAKLGFESVRLE
ncbi:MAG: helix-turn-helix domain-containing protein [Pseudomonadota bacterium]